MEKDYHNYTVGLDETTYRHLKNLALLNRMAIRQYLTKLVLPEYEKNKENISKLQELLDSAKVVKSDSE